MAGTSSSWFGTFFPFHSVLVMCVDGTGSVEEKGKHVEFIAKFDIN